MAVGRDLGLRSCHMIPTFIEKIIGYIVGKLFQLFYDEEDPYRWWNPLNVRGETYTQNI